MRPIVYIDPQSYQNLAIYDYSLLSNIDGDIHYVCSKLYNYKQLPPNIRQHRLFEYSKYRQKPLKAISYIFTCLLLAWRLIWWRPSVIHVQWFRIPAFDARFYILMKRVLGCKIVFTAHNVLPHDTGNRYFSYFDYFYRHIEGIIVHTHASKRELKQKMGIEESKIAVIDHGLLQPSYDPELLDSLKQDLDNHYQLAGKMVFSSLGYQYYYKGVDLLVEVWATTPELCNNDKCKLLLIGKNRGVDLSRAEGIKNIMIEDRITSDEEFCYLMKHTGISLLPYRTISQSGLLLTSIYFGTPFLVTNVGGLAEPLDIAPVGWLLPQLSKDALRQQLLWFLNHPEEVWATKANQANWDKLRQHYSWERIGALTQAIYLA